jgi:hypothetical protein
MANANYIFLPWVRQGAVSSIQQEETLSSSQQAIASLPVTLAVNNSPPINKQVQLYGPGDITGIDPQQIVRLEPQRLTQDFEPNYFPAIEFDRPDFPWLFTPAKADKSGKLRPWLCLVVVRKQEGITIRNDPNQLLPTLEIKSPAKPELELPDLSESYAWAHTQITGSTPDKKSLLDSLAGNPSLTVSRIISPRRLDPITDYIACLVPAFELGRRAGLGLPIENLKELQPAWDRNSTSSSQVTLPLYYHWEFRTGLGADFEALVKLLERRDLSEQVGKRLMDISQPGFNIDPALKADTKLELEGALRPLKQTATISSPPDEWANGSQIPFQTHLKAILNEAAQPANLAEPLLSPPIYGKWHAARQTVENPLEASASQSWLDQLNLDPRHRAVAALGTQVIQSQQEHLMASAWKQLGNKIQRINQTRRQAQLALAVNMVYHEKILSKLPVHNFLSITSIAHSQMLATVSTDSESHAKAQTKTFFRQKVMESPVPESVFSGSFRRITRLRGNTNRQFLRAGVAGINLTAKMFIDGNAANVPIINHSLAANAAIPTSATLDPGFTGTSASSVGDTKPPPNKPNPLDKGPVTIDRVTNVAISFLKANPTVLDDAEDVTSVPIKRAATPAALAKKLASLRRRGDEIDIPDVEDPPPKPPRPTRSRIDGVLINRLEKYRLNNLLDAAIGKIVMTPPELYEAVKAHQAYISQVFMQQSAKSLATANLGDFRTMILGRLNPKMTIRATVQASINIKDTQVKMDDPLEPLMDAPEFPQPMYEALRELAQDFVLPGLEHVSPNTIALLQTNPKFVEAFLVGLNYEMGRELLWRGYPTDQRGTYFNQFWDTSISDAEDKSDIGAVTGWGASKLGNNAKGHEQLVLLVRGELLRRYPNSVIYAVKGDGKGELSKDLNDERHPVFRGTLSPDLTFLGFNLDPNTAKTQDWYFVIQQQPTEPRFGLDEAKFADSAPSALIEWNDLNWRHVANTEADLKALSYISVKAALPMVGTRIENWERNSAHLAYITLQRPVRVAIPANDLIKDHDIN